MPVMEKKLDEYAKALKADTLRNQGDVLDLAASRRSLGRVSVPVWLIILSDQLWIVALVSHYPTN